jgi:hypothetical protein
MSSTTTTTRTTTAARRCTHHWLIDDPDGPESIGRCRGCGSERVFQNTPARVPFDRSMRDGDRYRSSVRWSTREEIRLSDEQA